MDFSCQLHALIPAGGGVHLWVERVAGREVVTDAAMLTQKDLPGELLKLVHKRPLRVRGKQWLATPKGKLKQVPVPTVAFTPEQSLSVMASLASYALTHTDPSHPQPPGISPEILFLIQLYHLCMDIVRTGRLMVRMHKVDGQWFPQWMPSTAGSHHHVVEAFSTHVPLVLSINSGQDVVQETVDNWVHWMAIRTLQSALGDTLEVRTPFIRSLVSGEPTPRVSATTVSLLNRWRVAALDAASSIVLVLSAPEDALLAASAAAKKHSTALLAEQSVKKNTGKNNGRDAGQQSSEQLNKYSVVYSEDDSSHPSDMPTEVGEGTVGATEQALATEEDSLAGVRWRMDIAMSINEGPVEPVIPAEITPWQKSLIQREVRRMYSAWPEMERILTPVEEWLKTGIWHTHPDAVTADPAKDRALAVALSAQDIEELLMGGISELQRHGICAMVPKGWVRVDPQVRVRLTPVGQGAGSGKLGLEQLVDFDFSLSIHGVEVDSSTRKKLLASAAQVVEVNGHFVFLQSAALTRARQWFRALSPSENSHQSEGSAALSTLLDAHAWQGEKDDEDVDHHFRVEANGWISYLLGSRKPAPPEPVDIPSSVRTPLREHQQRGVAWLAWMSAHRLGALLADDMGLGKTLQVLAFVEWEKQRCPAMEARCEALAPVAATLVVAPTSVLDAWEAEARRHVPGMRVVVDHGAQRVSDAQFSQLAARNDIVVTSYGSMARNPQRYQSIYWRRVVADEAQNIKNPATKQSRYVRSLRAEHRIAVTGTPMENRLADLYSLMDFANPGILGSPAAFQNWYAIPIERYDDERARERLMRIVEPFILRRLKTDPAVGLSLPEKHDHIELVPLTPEQAALYQAFTESLKEQLKNHDATRRGIILGALVKIKQICNHPAHYSGDGSGLMRDAKHRSHKVRRLFEIIDQALTQGRKVLVFTQFPTFGKMLIPAMQKRWSVEVPLLDGGLSRSARAQMVHRFQTPDGPPIMVLSVRAGGTGITLTEASVVVHIDRWWNPAVEDQATDRAYRIGQNKDVTVYKLVTTGTIDERIHDIITGKRQLASAIIGAGEGWIANLEDADIEELLHLQESSVKAAEGDYHDANPMIGTHTPPGRMHSPRRNDLNKDATSGTKSIGTQNVKEEKQAKKGGGNNASR